MCRGDSVKSGKRLLVQVGKRFGILALGPIVGVLGASALFIGTLILWILGFLVVPVAIMQGKLADKKWHDDPQLPKWASWWDDSEDLDVRGRPQGTFVWNFDMSWGMATFVHLQFYNPLANLRVKFMEKHRQVTGRQD